MVLRTTVISKARIIALTYINGAQCGEFIKDWFREMFLNDFDAFNLLGAHVTTACLVDLSLTALVNAHWLVSGAI